VRKLGAQNSRVYPLLGRALANLTISGEAPLDPNCPSPRATRMDNGSSWGRSRSVAR